TLLKNSHAGPKADIEIKSEQLSEINSVSINVCGCQAAFPFLPYHPKQIPKIFIIINTFGSCL
ncbi:MAG: hypothetical protein Q7R48_01410, partial [bacterium]|nr:hypothetical protein [bacterium]